MNPLSELRDSYKTVLEGNVTYTRRGGATQAPYFERFPTHDAIYPFLHFRNAVATPRNSRGCKSWEVLVLFEVVTGFNTPDHAKKDWADEMEEQVIDLITAAPLTLAGFTSNTPDFESSVYHDEIIFSSRGKDAKAKHYIIKKLTEFKHSIQQI